MKQVFINKFKTILAVALCLSAIWGTASAQEETEPARSSSLIGVALPANARRVLPQSVPAEVAQTLEKIVEAGNGKLRQGDTEVIVWAGADYRKANAAQITKQLRGAWQADGWMFEIGGEANGTTLFSLLKDGEQRRAVVGFYGATEEAYVLALTELFRTDNATVNSKSENEEPAGNEPQANVEAPVNKTLVKSSATLRDLTGKWEKKSTLGATVDSNTKAYLGSSGNYESYEFSADGQVAYSMLISVQQGRCNLSAFGQSKGRASVSGAEMTISLGAGTIDRKDTCNASGDYKKTTDAMTHTYGWTVSTDEYGSVQLCLTEANGEKYYYRKVK